MNRDSLEIVASGKTHPGLKRDSNQDALFFEFPVFIVADGMGGHAAGDVASAKIVSHFTPLQGRTDVSLGEVIQIIRAAQADVSELADAIPGGAGSTLTGLVAVTNTTGSLQWLVFNLGDSRTYRWWDAHLQQLTHDHSEVQLLIDSGRLDVDEAQHYPRRNVISRAVGDGVSEADYWLTPLVPDSRFLVCSDGLSTPVGQAQIAAILANVPDSESAVEALCEAALAAGGPDNITAIVVDVIGEDAGNGPAELPLEPVRPLTFLSS